MDAVRVLALRMAVEACRGRTAREVVEAAQRFECFIYGREYPELTADVFSQPSKDKAA